MHRLAELLVPAKTEVLFYTVLAAALLTTLCLPDLWRALLSSLDIDAQTSTAIGVSLHHSAAAVTRLPDPQIVNAIIWGLTAALALIIVASCTHFMRLTMQDAAQLHSKSGEMTFIVKLCLRVGGTLALLSFAVLFVSRLLPATLWVYEKALIHPTVPLWNLLWGAGAVVSTAVELYAFALLCRLITLRVRVFEDIID